MPGIIMTCEVLDRTPIKILKRELSRIRREALRELVMWFHEVYVPRRFSPGNDTRYQHAKRNDVYKNRIKRRRGIGQGKYVNNVLTGASRRRAMAFAKATATANQATLRVETPTYFRRPFKGTTRNRKGGITTINNQPDKVAETVFIPRQELEELRLQFQKILTRKLRQLQSGQEQRRKIAA